MSNKTFKVREIIKDSKTQWKKYALLVVGTCNILQLLKYEVVTFVCQGMSGALGLLLRKKFYPLLLAKKSKNLIIGKNVTLRHPHKIYFGDNVIIDDNCVIDAKGESNKGIIVGNDVFIGRNSIISTKNGEILIGDSVNIGVNCNLYSKNRLSINKNTMVAAYCYIMSGGQYDYRDPKPFAQQNSCSRGPTEIGENCWLGARVTVVDSTRVGDGSVIGANSFVTSDIPANVIAVGVPAKVIKSRF